MGGCSPLGILAFLCLLENPLPLGGVGILTDAGGGGGLKGWKKLKMRKKTVKYVHCGENYRIFRDAEDQTLPDN
jgi:hypothetical protein